MRSHCDPGAVFFGAASDRAGFVLFEVLFLLANVFKVGPLIAILRRLFIALVHIFGEQLDDVVFSGLLLLDEVGMVVDGLLRGEIYLVIVKLLWKG